jgi:predicted MPP superfamily phosphohydrolase
MERAMDAFTWASLAGAALVALAAAVFRGVAFAVFASILLAIHTSISVAIAPSAGPLFPLYAYLQAAVYVHFAMLARARMRPLAYRALVSVPASWFVAGTFLAFPWAIARGFGFDLPGVFVPYALALLGLLQSLRHQPEEIDIVLGPEDVPDLRRHPHGEARVERPLRIVQITDPHLGPFMSEQRLRGICARAVAKDPDLVLLTGDFLTMESHGEPAMLARALAPLASLPGRVFACHGNHDHEAPETVATALAMIGAKLLVDDAAEVETPAGRVQIVGMDFHFRARRARMAAVCARHPRKDGLLRVVLLHDPGAFKHLESGEADLVLSGHTHGGQLGLLSLGLPHTIVSALGAMPDHGLWAHGKGRLYVHRGTGHYGFPLRIGVPAEESLLRVHVARE